MKFLECCEKTISSWFELTMSRSCPTQGDPWWLIDSPCLFIPHNCKNKVGPTNHSLTSWSRRSGNRWLISCYINQTSNKGHAVKYMYFGAFSASVLEDGWCVRSWCIFFIVWIEKFHQKINRPEGVDVGSVEVGADVTP